MTYATYNITDDRLRLSLGAKPSPEQIDTMRKVGFSFWPGQKLNVTKWTPEAEDYILSLGIEIEEDDTPDNVESRIARFSGYAENAQANASAANDRAHNMLDGIPLGQASAKPHARASKKRVDAALKTAVSETARAAHWKSRIAGAIGQAQYKERPDVIARRIKRLEADQRTYERHISKKAFAEMRAKFYWDVRKAYAERFNIELGNRELIGMVFQDADFIEVTNNAWNKHTAWANRWLEHIRQRLEYERALLEATGGQVGCKHELEVGGKVQCADGWFTILRINRKGGEIISVTTSARYSRVKEIGGITDYRPPNAEEKEKAVAATKKPPLCNYPGEGFHHTTKAEWDDCGSDYKGANRIIEATEKHAKHRVRTMIVNHQYPFVFIADIKETWPPENE